MSTRWIIEKIDAMKRNGDTGLQATGDVIERARRAGTLQRRGSVLDECGNLVPDQQVPFE